MRGLFCAAMIVGLLAPRLSRAQGLILHPPDRAETAPLGAWVSLVAANHAAAAFDAVVTRQSIAAGNREQDPFDQPFVHSKSLYLVTQLGPLIPDALGFWMLRNDRKWMRPIWWVPQMVYIFIVSWSAYHNVKITY